MPPDTRRMIEDKIISSRFSHYKKLAAELADMGIKVSQGVLQRYGQTLFKNIGGRLDGAGIRSLYDLVISAKRDRSIVVVIDLDNDRHLAIRSKRSLGDIVYLLTTNRQ